MILLRLFLSADGRITRQPYILGGLALTVVAIALQSLAISIDDSGIASLVIGLALLWPNIALGIKRAHDRGRSGWFLLVGLIPVIGALWALVELVFLRGTGPNRFGPDPLAAGQVGMELPGTA